MMDKDRIDGFNRVVKMAQDKIIDFLETYGGGDSLKKAKAVFDSYPVILSDTTYEKSEYSELKAKQDSEARSDYILIDNSKFDGYSTNNHHELDDFIESIIEAYAHEFRHDSGAKYQKSFEDDASSLFAEMCMNFSNAKDLKSADKLFDRTDIFDHEYSQNELRGILYFLKEHNLDITLLTKYVFGDEKEFLDKCIEIFGDDFKAYFEEVTDEDSGDSGKKSRDKLKEIFKEYEIKNKVSYNDYFENKSNPTTTLYSPSSYVLEESVSEVGSSVLLDTERKLYDYFESAVEAHRNPEQVNIETVRENVIADISDRYNIRGRTSEEAYNILSTLSTDYNAYINRNDPEARIYIEELRQRIPNIDEIALNFTRNASLGLGINFLQGISPTQMDYNLVTQRLRTAVFNRGGINNTETAATGVVSSGFRDRPGVNSTVVNGSVNNNQFVNNGVNVNVGVQGAGGVPNELERERTATTGVGTVDDVVPREENTGAVRGANYADAQYQGLNATQGNVAGTMDGTADVGLNGSLNGTQNVENAASQDEQVDLPNKDVGETGFVNNEPVDGNNNEHGQSKSENQPNGDTQNENPNVHNLESPNPQTANGVPANRENSTNNAGNTNLPGNQSGTLNNEQGDNVDGSQRNPLRSQHNKFNNPNLSNNSDTSEGSPVNQRTTNRSVMNNARSTSEQNPENSGTNENNNNSTDNVDNNQENTSNGTQNQNTVPKSNNVNKPLNKKNSKKNPAKDKAKDAVKDKFFQKYKKKIIIIACIIGIALFALILFISLVVMIQEELESQNPLDTDANAVETSNISGYEYMSNNYGDTIKLQSSDGKTQNIKIDDYVAGVLGAEVGDLNNIETLKAQAIAARTYALQYVKVNGSICNSSRCQNYTSNKEYLKEDSIYRQAAVETSGLVLAKQDGESYDIFLSEYDAFCFESNDGTNYTLKQQHQVIPSQWVTEHVYNKIYRGCPCNKNDRSMTQCWSGNTWLDGGHGNGLSQWGAFYLGTEKSWTYQQILNYYYPDAKIMTLNKSGGTIAVGDLTLVSSDLTQTTNAGIIRVDIDTFLKSHGSSLTQLNNMIYMNAKKAGPGTPAAVAAVASTVITTMDKQFNARLPYAWAGGQNGGYTTRTEPRMNIELDLNSYMGLSKYVGTPALHDGKVDAKYPVVGYDCAGFVAWAMRNAGIELPSGGHSTREFDDLADPKRGEVVSVENGSEAVAGDLLIYNQGLNGHIMIILSYNASNKTYRVAEASGSAEGILISEKSISYLKGHGYKLYKMTRWYSEHKMNDYDSRFSSQRMDGVNV